MSQGEGPEKSRVEETQITKATTSISMVGQRIGDYQVMRLIGRGGMSEVYAARDLSLDRDVALKVLRQDLARDKDYVERFRREARAAAKLNHPNIVQVYEVNSCDSTYYIAQELIDGDNLRQHLQDVGQIGPEMAVDVLISVTSALQVAAELGITHRDIKPENIILGPRGEIKVADFGLARLQVDADVSQAGLTQAGFALGTPRYMSPEQVQGKPVDARSDLYSLGVTMYHLLAGRPPFDSDDPLALAYSHLNETPKPIDRLRGNDDLPQWLIAIVSRLTLKNPADRFQSPSELLDTLRGDTTQTAAYGVGVSSATAQLQRAADAARRQNRIRLLRRAALLALPLLSLASGLALFSQGEDDSVGRMLRPDLHEADDVDEQFLIAAVLNNEMGWRAVEKFFPADESEMNREYAVKAQFQLARLDANNERYVEAEEILTQIQADRKVDLKYRVVAAARLCRLLDQMGAKSRLASEKSKYIALYNELKSVDEAAIDWFKRVVPEKDRAGLEMVAVSEGDS